MPAGAEASEKTVLGKASKKAQQVKAGALVMFAPSGHDATPASAAEAALVEEADAQVRLARAESSVTELYKIAEAAQAAIDVLRPKLAEAESEIDLLSRDRTAIAAELYREATAREVAEQLGSALRRKCDVLAAEVFHLARDRVRLVAQRAAGLTTLIDPAFDPLFWNPARLGALSGWWAHVPFAHWLVRATAPRVLVELGTFTGVSYSAFCHAVVEADLPTRCHAVDTWQGDRHAGAYGEEVYEDFRQFHDRHYGQFSTLLRCAFDAALDRFADGSIDLLHIDGLHTYEAVRHDFESWLPKLSQQAIVLFHDTNVRDGDFGVWRLWEELRDRYPSFEFLHGYGLGVLAVGETAPEAVLALCRLADQAAIATLRNRFAVLGERWVQAEKLELSIATAMQARSEAAELASQIAALTALEKSLNAELRRLETKVTDRARAAEMAENATALKAGELNRARREIATLSGPPWRRVARTLGSLSPRFAASRLHAPGSAGKDLDRRLKTVPGPAPEAVYAIPHLVGSMQNCHFYHTMELPGCGVVEGDWDLRDAIDDILAGQEFAGQRVLEIGPASGYLTFEMERRGADVVSIEVPDDPGWDFVPHTASVLEPVYGPRREIMRRLKNSYWFTHAAIKSRARICYGDVYRLPDALGQFDIAIMSNVLLHTRSPLAVVEQCAQRSRSLMIIDRLHPDLEGQPVCQLVPSAENRIWDTWWQFSTDFFAQFLGVLGFGGFIKTTHLHRYRDGATHTFFTLVGQRSASGDVDA
jgi:SAM-dependent methyltransferase